MFYFQLQYRRFNRMLADFGLSPWVAYPLLLVGFVLLAETLFYKTDYAAYVLVFFATYTIAELSKKNHVDFLKRLFLDKTYRQVRFVENALIALPFLIYLCYQSAFLFALALFLLATLLSLVSFGSGFSFTIPTPFSKMPFEFTAGFRKSWLAYLLAIFLVIKGCSMDHFNLAISSVILLYLASMAFYLHPEPRFYVWIYSDSPKAFLLRKMKTAAIGASILALPLFIPIIIFFADQILLLLLLHIIGILLVITVLLAKYAAFPGEINLAQTVLLALSLIFPPMLIFVIPLFYKKALKQLRQILV